VEANGQFHSPPAVAAVVNHETGLDTVYKKICSLDSSTIRPAARPYTDSFFASYLTYWGYKRIVVKLVASHCAWDITAGEESSDYDVNNLVFTRKLQNRVSTKG
jgi:hypothetical protein